MADFKIDTDLIAAADGTYGRVLSQAWEIWGPNGGYVAALALRTAGLHCQRPRPANATVHFLGVANFEDPVVITPTTLRQTRNATSVAVSMTQLGKPILHALVWAIDDDLPGLSHDEAPMPDVPMWNTLPTVQERFAASGIDAPIRFRFWENFDQRPPTWIDDWDNRVLGAPLYHNWMRFNSTSDTTDRWLHAARLLTLVDLGGYPAVGLRHNTESFVAPSLDVSCEFHHLNPSDDWHLLQGISPVAADGLIGSHQSVWNDVGQLVASGVSHLFCRPVR